MAKRIALCMCSLLLCCIALAQDTKNITLVVPYSPGAAQDIFARLISEPLSQELRFKVLVINKPGGGGTVGAAYVAQAKPDVPTYLVAASGHHLSGALHERLPYHPLEGFRGVVFTGYAEFVLITSAELKTPDLPSFVNLVKTRPNQFNFASSGNGSTTHIGMASFLERAGLQMVHLPLRGTNEIINEVISGRVHAAMVSVLSIQSFKSDPRIKLIATTSLHRSEFLIDLPTISEQGFDQYKWLPWSGILAPASAPIDRLQEMNHAMAKVLQEPKMKSRLEQLGLTASAMSLHQFNNVLRDDWIHSSDVIGRLKLSVD